MSYKYDPFQHCCPTMNEYLDPACNTDELPLIEYDIVNRKYSFFIRYKGEDYTLYQPLLYCPWCGKKLPKILSDKWEEVLEKEYGITEYDRGKDGWGWNDGKDLPKEFYTDEWWKKRGL